MAGLPNQARWLVPISKYNRYFGGKKGSAAETLAAMIRRYGEKKGRSIFYATVNQRKRKK